MPTVEYEVFARSVRRLMQLLIESRRDIEILYGVPASGVPLDPSIYTEVRARVAKDIAPVMKLIEETPDDKILEFLRNYQGTVQ